MKNIISSNFDIINNEANIYLNQSVPPSQQDNNINN